jgi:hypothetical protein
MAGLIALAVAKTIELPLSNPGPVPGPAAVTVAPAPESTGAGQYVVVDVTAYMPPGNGVVQGVVTVQKNTGGTEQKIGRFGIFPNTEFSAADPSKVRWYFFPLPRVALR